MARIPCNVRLLRAPELHHWESLGRVAAAYIATSQLQFVVVGVYGFAVSHERHGDNEGMFACIAMWARSLTSLLIIGDFNGICEY